MSTRVCVHESMSCCICVCMHMCATMFVHVLRVDMCSTPVCLYIWLWCCLRGDADIYTCIHTCTYTNSKHTYSAYTTYTHRIFIHAWWRLYVCMCAHINTYINISLSYRRARPHVITSMRRRHAYVSMYVCMYVCICVYTDVSARMLSHPCI